MINVMHENLTGSRPVIVFESAANHHDIAWMDTIDVIRAESALALHDSAIDRAILIRHADGTEKATTTAEFGIGRISLPGKLNVAEI